MGRPHPSELGLPGLKDVDAAMAFPCIWPGGPGLLDASRMTA